MRRCQCQSTYCLTDSFHSINCIIFHIVWWWIGSNEITKLSKQLSSSQWILSIVSDHYRLCLINITFTCCYSLDTGQRNSVVSYYLRLANGSAICWMSSSMAVPWPLATESLSHTDVVMFINMRIHFFVLLVLTLVVKKWVDLRAGQVASVVWARQLVSENVNNGEIMKRIGHSLIGTRAAAAAALCVSEQGTHSLTSQQQPSCAKQSIETVLKIASLPVRKTMQF